MLEDAKQIVDDFAKKISGGSQEVYNLILTCLPDDIYSASKEEIEEVFNEIDIETLKKMVSSIEETKMSQQKTQSDIDNDLLDEDIDMQEKKQESIVNEQSSQETIDDDLLTGGDTTSSDVKEDSDLINQEQIKDGNEEKHRNQDTQTNIGTNANNSIINNGDSSDSISDLISQKSFGYHGICRIIPQRPPFLMIDKVINLDIKNKIAICQKCVSANEGFFAGHFPDNPVMPGVLMIEAMAQAASIIGKALMNGKKGTLLFASADNVKFNGIATAGDVLTIEAQVIKLRDPLVIGECKVKKQDEIICSCSLKAFRKDI